MFLFSEHAESFLASEPLFLLSLLSVFQAQPVANSFLPFCSRNSLEMSFLAFLSNVAYSRLPSGPVVKNLPSNAEYLGLILVRKLRSHEPQINYPQLHSSIETRETAATKTTACCNKDPRVLQLRLDTANKPFLILFFLSSLL